ncbi:MAG: hypothetical protein ABI721_00715 [Candidatus Dojkabacteria bacterium]
MSLKIFDKDYYNIGAINFQSLDQSHYNKYLQELNVNITNNYNLTINNNSYPRKLTIENNVTKKVSVIFGSFDSTLDSYSIINSRLSSFLVYKYTIPSGNAYTYDGYLVYKLGQDKSAELSIPIRSCYLPHLDGNKINFYSLKDSGVEFVAAPSCYPELFMIKPDPGEVLKIELK